MNKLAQFAANQTRDLGVTFRAGDTVKVYQKIKEGDKRRIQIFEGVVIAKKHGKGASATFTVRKVASGVGVEKIYPLHSPVIDKIEVVKRTKAKRNKLYYIRAAKGKKARMKAIQSEMQTAQTDTTQEEAVPEESSSEEKDNTQS